MRMLLFIPKKNRMAIQLMELVSIKAVIQQYSIDESLQQLRERSITTLSFSGNIIFQMLDGLLLVGDNFFHDIADGNQSH